MPSEFKTTYLRTPPHILTKYNVRDKGEHDLYYKKRTHRYTGVSHYKPYCKCGNWESDNWYPTRNANRMERLFEYEHLTAIANQGQLQLPS